jgi:hypothetical protein
VVVGAVVGVVDGGPEGVSEAVGPSTVTVAVGPGTVTVAVGPGTVTVAVGPGTRAVTVTVAVGLANFVPKMTWTGCRHTPAFEGVNRPPATTRTVVITVTTEIRAANPALAWAPLAVVSARCLRLRLLCCMGSPPRRSWGTGCSPQRVSN